MPKFHIKNQTENGKWGAVTTRERDPRWWSYYANDHVTDASVWIPVRFDTYEAAYNHCRGIDSDEGSPSGWQPRMLPVCALFELQGVSRVET